jgi:malate/lactate dehydrogenase
VGSKGVQNVINFPLSPSEEKKFVESAETLWTLQEEIWDKI